MELAPAEIFSPDPSRIGQNQVVMGLRWIRGSKSFVIKPFHPRSGRTYRLTGTKAKTNNRAVSPPHGPNTAKQKLPEKEKMSDMCPV
jgi:hypothetical protein